MYVNASVIPRFIERRSQFTIDPAIYPHLDLYPAPGGVVVFLQPTTQQLLRSSHLLPNTVEPLYPTSNLC